MTKKSERRSIWGDPDTTSPQLAERVETDLAGALQSWNGGEVEAPAAPVHQPPKATSIVEQLRVAKKSRKREWEQSHRSHAFRGIAPNVHMAVRSVADNEGFTVDQIVEAMLGFGIVCYRRDEIAIEPVLSNQRRTLFPEGQAKKGEVRWTEKTWGLKPPKKRLAKSKPEKVVRPWKDWPVVSYRLSNDTFEKIVEICFSKQANRGEVVTKLLMHALDAYEAGRLVFESDEPALLLEEWQSQ